jgi:hypothetical protein
MYEIYINFISSSKNENKTKPIKVDSIKLIKFYNNQNNLIITNGETISHEKEKI